jgi:hypothetical protein
MKQYNNALPDELCKDIYNFAIGTITGKNVNSEEKVDVWTNYAWEEYLVQKSSAVICMKLPKNITDSITNKLVDLGLMDLSTDVDFYNGSGCMAFVWTPGSYIGKHSDGLDRKTITLYLNEDWDIEDGGMFHWYNESIREWKTIVPKYNSMVVNNGGLMHYTTPTLNKDKFRVSLQIFIVKK